MRSSADAQMHSSTPSAFKRNLSTKSLVIASLECLIIIRLDMSTIS